MDQKFWVEKFTSQPSPVGNQLIATEQEHPEEIDYVTQ